VEILFAPHGLVQGEKKGKRRRNPSTFCGRFWPRGKKGGGNVEKLRDGISPCYLRGSTLVKKKGGQSNSLCSYRVDSGRKKRGGGNPTYWCLHAVSHRFSDAQARKKRRKGGGQAERTRPDRLVGGGVRKTPSFRRAEGKTQRGKLSFIRMETGEGEGEREKKKRGRLRAQLVPSPPLLPPFPLRTPKEEPRKKKRREKEGTDSTPPRGVGKKKCRKSGARCLARHPLRIYLHRRIAGGKKTRRRLPLQPRLAWAGREGKKKKKEELLTSAESTSRYDDNL